ncbi:MAG: hypothetical protein EPO21_23540 [Chloroflexota bacterium]|nr:MAG: hypothetical protein EPO21_23540 [Chloroflexota bacterium]
MPVKIRVYGLLRTMIEESPFSVEFPGGSLADLVERLSRERSEEFRKELLDEEGNLDYAYMVIVSGERVTDIAAPIKPDDEVVITSMLAGG